MTKTEKLYNVTRWCCTSGDCIDCHQRRESGDYRMFPNTAARVRVVQCKELSKERAERARTNWNVNGFEPKVEAV